MNAMKRPIPTDTPFFNCKGMALKIASRTLVKERTIKIIPSMNTARSASCQLYPMPSAEQTVYAKYDGSAAAPTAGLHFTKELLEKVKEKGVDIAEVTLHVGLGTFRPVKVENVLEHHMHSEFYMVSAEAAEKINATKDRGGRVIAVGTTSTRTLESAADENGRLRECSGWTEIFIYPGYTFKVIDCLITNFHLPQSTLVMLVSALAGRENVLAAYEEAVNEKYRFFSFGDAMFITDNLIK